MAAERPRGPHGKTLNPYCLVCRLAAASSRCVVAPTPAVLVQPGYSSHYVGAGGAVFNSKGAGTVGPLGLKLRFVCAKP